MNTRRGLLRSIGGGLLASVAGCADVESGGGGTGVSGTVSTAGGQTERTRSATPSEGPFALGESAVGPDGTVVTVDTARLWKIVYSVDGGTDGGAAPIGDADTQFLVVDVSTDRAGEAPSLPLVITLDGEPVTRDAYGLDRDPEADRALAFVVPIGPASTGAIEWRPSEEASFRWELPDFVLSDMGRTPVFEVRRFEVPGSIGPGSRFQATIEVANVGRRGGRFLAEVRDAAAGVPLVSGFTMDVPTGVSFTKELAGRTVDEDRSDGTAILDWGIDRREASFSLA